MIKKTLLIAEKPSVAKIYCELLETAEGETFQKKNGYFSGNQYDVSWCYGHLVTTEQPEAYGWGEWSLDTLPMIPTDWKYKASGDGSAKKQLDVICSLIKDSACVINGADAGREGELIYRLVLHFSGFTLKNKEQKRLWTSSFVMKDLLKAWQEIEPLSNYNNLFTAAALRQKADWIVGLNASRLYSLTTGTTVSVGRVQTPTLELIVSRDHLLETWKKSFYDELHVTWEGISWLYKASDNKSKFSKPHDLVLLQSQIKLATASLKSVIKENKRNNPAKPFNLSRLQVAGNGKFGFTTEKVLNIAQSLYEKQLVTYPRTDSQYLPASMVDEAYLVLESLSDFGHDLSCLHKKGTILSFFNDKKVSDHYAIIPTTNKSKNLSPDEDKILTLIQQRFINSFGLPFIYDETKAIIKCVNSEDHFYSIFKAVVDNGYKGLFSSIDDKEVVHEFDLKEGHEAVISDSVLIEKEVTPPLRFTEGLLITAMETAGKTIEDKELRDAMKENGLGTPATRASIIETLKRQGYITVSKKNLISTKKGRALIKLVDSKLKSPQLTGDMEKQLKQIADGVGVGWKSFLTNIEDYTTELCTSVKSDSNNQLFQDFKKESSTYLECPKCQQKKLLVTGKGLFCQTDKDTCGFVLWPEAYSKKLTSNNILELITNRKTKGKIKGLKLPGSDKFDAVLVLDDSFKVRAQKQSDTVRAINHSCPKCESSMIMNDYGVFCKDDKTCKFKIFRKCFDKLLTDKDFEQLFAGTTIGPFKNLTSQKGKFTASLFLKDDHTIGLNFNNKKSR